MKSMVMSVAMLSVCVAGASARAQHLDDIALGVSGGRIATGVFQVQGTDVVTILSPRVFLAAFDIAPNFTNEPGFESEVGVFAGGSRIGFNIRKALRKWDGASFPSGPEGIPPERIQIRLGPSANTSLSPLNDEPVAGFSLAVSGAGGSEGQFHQHPGFTLLEPASDGIYLLELEFWSTQAGLEPSRPFWVVFSQNADDAEWLAAASWARANVWSPACPADLNDDGLVDDTDFGIFIVAYNYLLCDPPSCPADLNGDWVTDDSDFLIFVTAYDALLCPDT